MTMKAAWYEKFGPAKDVLQVGEMPVPELNANEVLIRLFASGINPSDVKRRIGRRETMAFTRIIPHSDGAGVIEKVGSGVSKDRIGQRVWIYNARWDRLFGTAAEYVALPAYLAIPLPENTAFEAGACLGIPAMTAHHAVFARGPVKGKTVLVTGGAGSVGYYAIQFAKWGGAQVITTVSNPEKAHHAKNAGADFIINYREENIIEQIGKITKNQGVDHIAEVDFGGNLTTSIEILKLNGCIAAYASEGNHTPQVPFYPMMFKGISMHFVNVYDLPETARAQAIHDINTMLASNALQHQIATVFPLEEIIAAHELVESGKAVGNVVLAIA